MLPEDPAAPSIGRLARRLLAEAEAQPALIGRTEVRPRLTDTKAEDQPFQAMALLSDPAVDIRQYLEDLVSIAVDSAQHADGVSLQVQEAKRRVRRGMAIVAGFGALGLAVGVAGFAASRSSNIRLSEVRQQVGLLQDMQRQAQDELSSILARTGDVEQRETAVEVAHPASTVPAAVATQTLPPEPSVVQPQPRNYVPWPDSRPPVRHGPQVRSGTTVVVPQFVANIQRGLRAIFR